MQEAQCVVSEIEKIAMEAEDLREQVCMYVCMYAFMYLCMSCTCICVLVYAYICFRKI